ncbi:MAG: type 4a pilus biogenesis protein PilO [Deltaproteobacteria bacterium]|nr:type 4a pilus biogenesis protein PilO [Deltaproteobacteria bacterium]
MAAHSFLEKISVGKKILILFLFLILIGVGYYFVLHRDKNQQLENERQAFTRLVREEKDWLERKKNYMQDVEELNRKKERQREQIRILPPEQEMSSFLNDLDNLAGLAGLDIKLIEPRSEQGAGFYAKIPVRLVLHGRFHQISKFFYSIGKLERIINIENIEFTNVSEEGTDVKITSKVTATTFRALEKTSPNRPAPPAAGG